METIKSIANSINKHLQRNAFCINEKFYTYNDLAKSISKIRMAIQNRTDDSDKNIGLIANDDLDTYAAIIAIWFEGKAFVPLSVETPKSRNENIIEQIGIITIIDTSEVPILTKKNNIEPSKLAEAAELNLTPKKVSDDENCIILFTSGTTGMPKGAPVTHEGIDAFMRDFWKIGFDIGKNDRCLQMFEITFDFATLSFLPPLLKGACVYTVLKNVTSLSYVYQLLEDHQLTTIGVVPSFLQYLRPYFDEIRLPKLKNCMLGGEALHENITKEWSNCVPNAKIFNAYGVTEDTIMCTYYLFNKSGNNKSHNGILTIGKAMAKSIVVVIDEDKNILPPGEKGELCLGGPQLTPGYWNNEERNKEAFFYTDYKGQSTRLYKTGDLCIIDEDGFVMYLGRIDFQAKIHGFRVELSEVEFHVQSILGKTNTVALAVDNKFGGSDLGLVIESAEFDTKDLLEKMKIKVEGYLVPSHIRFVEKFPLNLNGKIDRKELLKLFY